MKKILINLFLSFALLASFGGIAEAASTDINLTIRDGSTIVFSGAVPLQAAGNVNLTDNTGTPQSIDAQSVLSVVNDADVSSSDFSISNMEYYSSFGSLYLKCITDAVGTQCDNWQYTVNNSYPGIGMDKKILSGGENVYVYFGSQYKVVLSANTITSNDNVIVTANEYDYQNNAWNSRTGVTVGLTQPDPNNPWSPIEVQTGLVDANGVASFSAIAVGSYNVGIKEDYYFPTEALIVNPAPVTAVSVHHSGGGGSYILPEKKVFNEKNAFSFLISKQNENGSFLQDIYTDWAALAFASSPDYADQKNKIKQYLSENKLVGAMLTDYERRAMSLMALGVNPYDVGGENYIKKITDSFDGSQFGDKSLVNDDIFALLPLQSAGYTENDEMIMKDIQFIISKQNADGSWESSVDLTAAAVQALKAFESVSGVSDSLPKAGAFISSAEQDDGGWKNVSSTSWALQAMNVLGASWKKNSKSGIDYLAEQQAEDGAVSAFSETPENRIWATSYAMPAALNKSWTQIMVKFEKPKAIAASVPKEIIKTEIKKVDKVDKVKSAKKINSKAKNLASIAGQNTAAVVLADTNSPVTETPKKQNWFRKLMGKIFGF